MSRNGSEQGMAQTANRSTGVASGTPLSEQQITALFDRLIKQRVPSLARDTEALQVLVGERTGNREQAAVRRADLSLSIQVLPEVSAAPTMEEHNRLIKAFNELAVKLADIARKQ